MATETPQFNDGSQMVAAANYYNPGSALPGPGGSGQFLLVSISAARTVAVNTSQTAYVYGVLQNTPLLGEPADVCLFGITKAVAHAAISAGAELMSFTDGTVMTWVSGSTFLKIGVALEAASAINAVFTMHFYGGGARTLT